jgi:DHA3 family tetracycline resistance protein-like MFS transporter
LTDQQRAYRVYLGYGALMATFQQMIDPIVAVYYVRVVGLNPLELVLLGTITLIAGLIFQVPTGVIADTYSRRLAVIVGVFMIGVCFLVQGLLPILAVIVVAEALRGVGSTFINGALEAWIADEIGEGPAAAAYLRFAQVRQIGALVGTVVGTALATIYLGLAIGAGGALILVLGVGLIVVMPERGFTPHHLEPGERRGSWHVMTARTRAGFWLIAGRPALVSLLGVWACLALASEGLDRLWEAHLLAHFTFPAVGDLDPIVWFGVINALFMVASVFGTEAVRRWVDVNNPAAVARAMLWFSAGRIATLLLFGLAGDFYVAAAAYLSTESFRRMSQPLFTGWINRNLDPRLRATVLSMGGQVDAVGQLVGGPIIGLIGTAFSLRAAMVAAAGLLLPSLPLLVRAGRLAEEEKAARDA